MIVIRLTPQDDPPPTRIEVPEEFHGPEGERKAFEPVRDDEQSRRQGASRLGQRGSASRAWHPDI